MNKKYIKNHALASMIRGKSIEEAIRFSFSCHRDRMSVQAAQEYANDLYYLRTKSFSPKIVKTNAFPINILVKTGINAFAFLKIKNLSNNNSYKLNYFNKNKYVYPDFKTPKLQIDGKNINNCCIELKISNKRIKNSLKKHIKQCLNYSIKSRKPVLLLYLVYYRTKSKYIIYRSFPKFFLIKKNKWQTF
jgi:hypothetical protein